MKTYKAAEVVRAVGVSYDSLARWTDRNLIPCESTGSGHHREYNLARVCEIAIMNALVKLGVAPAQAAKYAATYSKPQYGRALSKLFAVNNTIFLVVDNDGARVAHKQLSDDHSDLLRMSSIVINLSALIGLLDHELSKIDNENSKSR